MKLLLDTQAFLWFGLRSPRLSPTADELIANPVNQLLLSAASYWEIAIKISIGKYELSQGFRMFMEEQLTVNRIAVLPILPEHANIVASLPFHHRDPFDRMLVAQAIVESIPIVSADAALDQYSVARLW